MSFWIKELYLAYIISFYFGQLEQFMACFKVLGSLSPLLAMFAFNILKIYIIWIYDCDIWVLINQARLEDMSLISRFSFKCLRVSKNLLDIGIKL